MKRRYWYIVLMMLALLAPAARGADEIRAVSGDGQIGITGYPLRADFVVQVLENGKPKAGVPVVFALVDQPEQSPLAKHRMEASLSSPLSVTDAEGLARTRLNNGYPGIGATTVTAATAGTQGAPVVFHATVNSRHWLLVIVLEIIGGLGIFLFGMFHLNDALQKAAGNRFRQLLITLTSSNGRGLVSGLFVTLFNQSSSATTVLEVSLVSAGLLTFYQTMAVTMGAEIGSTVTGQLIAFRLTDYAVFISGLGFYISFFMGKDRRWKYTGAAILGFGLLFLGMKIMTDTLVPLRSYPPFMLLMKSIEVPIYGILVGCAFTMFIHSSGATAGIVIALAIAGAISLEQAIPVTLGAQIGTCVTAALGSIGRGREGKRVALWHVIHQTAGVLLVYPFLTVVQYRGEPAWIHFSKWFTHTFFYSDDLARQIAMSHTMVAVFNTMVFLPLLAPIKNIMFRLLPSREQEKPFGPVYIEEAFLMTPSLAIDQARKEVLREGAIVQEMLQDVRSVFDTQNLKLCETVSLKDIRVDVLHNAVVPYLAKIGQGSLGEDQSLSEIELMHITADIEAIGDIIDKNVMPLARKKIENKLWFSDAGWQDILDLHARVNDNLARALAALRDNDMETAKLIAESETEVDHSESTLRRRHIERLHSGIPESLETSSVHLDLIDQFKRINAHVAAIGHALLGEV
jgi:phosphate:Na+ symporter